MLYHGNSSIPARGRIRTRTKVWKGRRGKEWEEEGRRGKERRGKESEETGGGSYKEQGGCI